MVSPDYDAGALYYRRAVGLEVRARPEESWAAIEIAGAAGKRIELDRRVAEIVVGMTAWTPAAETGLDPKRLMRLVDDDLLYFAPSDPGRPLTGKGGALAEGTHVRRRASMWPTAAIETAAEIAPMPFMPRGRDLDGAVMVGARFASLEKGTEVFGATIIGGARTGAILRSLLPMLDGHRTKAEIVARLGDDAARYLELLDALTILEPACGPPEEAKRFLRGEDQVTWLGHGAVLAQVGGTSLLVDPLFFSTSEPPEPYPSHARPDPRALPKIHGVLITHGDNDHLNAGSLAMLDPATPVLIPRVGSQPAPYQVDIRRVLSVLGFSDITELDPWDVVRIGSATITAFPFRGESWGLDLAKVTYLVESERARLFFAADSNAMPDVYARLAEKRVDLAFMGVSGNAETFAMPAGFGYGNFYRDWIPRARHNEWVRHCAGPREAMESLAIFTPRYAFGYAAGGASFIRTEYSDAGSHEELARLLIEAGAETTPVRLELGQPAPIEALTSWRST